MPSVNSHSLYSVRGANDYDANAILDIDIKCFESAWTPEHWSQVGHSAEYAISVATHFGTVIGFAIMRQPDASKGVELLKLAVKPAHQKNNVSLLLLLAAVNYTQAKRANHLFMVIPEHMVYPDAKGQCVANWLKEVGFTAVKPFLKDHFVAYGETEHGVKFISPISQRNPL
jgi:ribosomal protein S18 acetylase RimI-like enzyme